MKKYNKFLVIFAIVILFLVCVGLAITSKKQISQTVPSSTGSLSVSTQSGQVQVNDFTKQPEQAVGDNYVLSQTAGYSIDYFSKDHSFLITLLSEPVRQNRTAAELDLLAKLGIGQADACKLTVALTIPADVNEALSGQDWGLSFCPSGKAFPVQ